MDDYINPRECSRPRRRNAARSSEQAARSFPEQPEKDVLLFLIEHAPLKAWQRDILSIVRDEAYYFAPQGQTKIMNEGWASYWHSHHHDPEGAAAVRGASTTPTTTPAPWPRTRGRLNPYKLGIELLRDIEQRWNTGRFGKEYDDCDDLDKPAQLGQETRPGPAKNLRGPPRPQRYYLYRHVPDAGVLRRAQDVLSYAYQEQAGQYVIESREFEKIKQRLLFSLTNFGKPWIYVVDGNYRNRGELLLRHQHNGVDLRLDQAADTLANIQFIWSRPVHLQTARRRQADDAVLRRHGTHHQNRRRDR